MGLFAPYIYTMRVPMTESELKEIIARLREYTLSERQLNSARKIDIFFINAIEIACNLTELGLSHQLQIKKEEEYWFEGSHRMNFWDADIDRNLYRPLVTEGRRNWFR